ncbi:MAG: hypothetical protein HYX24_07020 [Candidatus Aenigmarchaeota archaeon]|nr:hypothetical protein [Candidatus Aenigmarchaeota archaeon]
MPAKRPKKRESGGHIRWVCLYIPLVILVVAAANILQTYISQSSGNILVLLTLILLLAAAYILAKRSSLGSRKPGK